MSDKPSQLIIAGEADVLTTVMLTISALSLIPPEPCAPPQTQSSRPSEPLSLATLSQKLIG